MFIDGKDVILRIQNTSLFASQLLSVKDPNGVAHAFQAGDRIIFDSITVNNRGSGSQTVTIFQDTDADTTYDLGEEIVTLTFSDVGLQQVFLQGLPSQKINAAKTNVIRAVSDGFGPNDIVIEARIVRD